MSTTGLIPFIERNHSADDTVLWPSLQPAHYTNESQNFMIESNIKCLDKAENPGVLPQSRPLIDYMAILKYKVYEGKWTAKSLEELENGERGENSRKGSDNKPRNSGRNS